MAITPIEAKHGWMLEVAARNYTNSTREYYEWYIGQFVAWLTDVGVTLLTDITPKHIRLYQTHKA
ncbi:MAG: phage integrase N-terminal SAM-like domain-containing protein, partial [Caldilinea sp.]|uniref:phage integrase N-terminal SAM-like domain-containing protein n=1 Tax=Caldilinea sp. TaxID=2293560 RepID=UPI0030B2D5B5